MSGTQTGLDTMLSGFDRVRAHTEPAINARIDLEIENRIRQYAGESREALTRRIAELEREWDVERWIEVIGGGVGLLSVLYGLGGRRAWLLLGLVNQTFLIHHGMKGWCPPMALLRRLGVRSRKEIEAERYALKALRGDFDPVTSEAAPKTVVEADDLLRRIRAA